MVQFGHFFFPVGRGSCLVLENTSQDYGNIPIGFIWVSSRPSFFAPFYFISMPNFDIVLRLFVLSPREGLYFSLILCPLPRGFEQVFIWGKNSKNNSQQGSKWWVHNYVGQYENYRNSFINTNVFIVQNAKRGSVYIRSKYWNYPHFQHFLITFAYYNFSVNVPRSIFRWISKLTRFSLKTL